MINGLMPKLHVITLEGFIMLTIAKSKGYDDVKNQPVLETVVNEGCISRGSLGKVFFDVSRSGVVIAGNNGVKLSTDEAVKLFAGLLEDIKATSA